MKPKKTIPNRLEIRRQIGRIIRARETNTSLGKLESQAVRHLAWFYACVYIETGYVDGHILPVLTAQVTGKTDPKLLSALIAQVACDHAQADMDLPDNFAERMDISIEDIDIEKFVCDWTENNRAR